MVCQSMAAGQLAGTNGTMALSTQAIISSKWRKRSRSSDWTKEESCFLRSLCLGKFQEHRQRLFAHVMLHPFRITSGNLRADADRQQEVLHDLMALAALASFSPSGVKKIRARICSIRPTLAAFEHFSDRRLRNAKTRGHIHGAPRPLR